MKIRVYHRDDFDALYRLDQECYPPGIAYSRFALRMFLMQPGTQAFVAEEGDEAVGFVLVEYRGADQGHVITLDVRADHRRRGVGMALLVEAEQWLAKRGVRRVRLETAVDNQAGIAFWEQGGYRRRTLLRGYYLDRIDAYEMEKELHART